MRVALFAGTGLVDTPSGLMNYRWTFLGQVDHGAPVNPRTVQQEGTVTSGATRNSGVETEETTTRQQTEREPAGGEIEVGGASESYENQQTDQNTHTDRGQQSQQNGEQRTYEMESDVEHTDYFVPVIVRLQFRLELASDNPVEQYFTLRRCQQPTLLIHRQILH